MYEELGPEGISRMVGDLRDLYSQDRLRQGNGGDRTTKDKRIDDEFISNMWAVMDAAGNLLISKHHDYGPLRRSYQWVASAYVGQDSPHK